MIIYYTNLAIFITTIYISYKIGQTIKKKLFKNKPNIKEMMHIEKQQLQTVFNAVKTPTKIDQKENLINLMQQIDTNYSKLIYFVIYYSIMPLIVLIFLEVVLQKMTIITIGGYDLKWYTILLTLLPIALLKLLIKVRKRNTQSSHSSTH